MLWQMPYLMWTFSSIAMYLTLTHVICNIDCVHMHAGIVFVTALSCTQGVLRAICKEASDTYLSNSL